MYVQLKSFPLIAAFLSQAIASKATPFSANQTSKVFTTSGGLNYAYDYVAAQDATKPTVLLLHGYPASRSDWENTIPVLAAKGYGVLAPDLLGFGASSKPTEVEAYNTKNITGDLAGILDAEGIAEVVGVGHDWGAGVLSKAVAWHRDRFTKLAFVSTTYTPAGVFFDVDAVNAAGIKTIGRAPFGYWYFFNSYDTADLIAENLDSFFSAAFHTNSSSWGVDFADIGAARAWLAANTTTDLPAWISPEYKARWKTLFSQPNATASSLNYYQALLRGIHAADEAVLTDEDRALRVPVLAVGAARDQIVPPESQKESIEPWAKAGFKQRIVDSGHWLPLEKTAELNEILLEFIERGL